MEIPGAVHVIWWVMLVVTVVVVIPTAVVLLHRLWRAARSIERYTAEALTAGLGIARNTANVSALDQTVQVGSLLVSVAGSIARHSAAIETTLVDRA
jgi:hypothetical protein